MSFNKETGMYEGYIYTVTNTENGRMYIGQTSTTVEERWKAHLKTCKYGKKKSYLHKAINGMGEECFEAIELEKVVCLTPEELSNQLDKLEQEYIRLYQTLVCQGGYNVERGGKDKRAYTHMRPVCKYDLELNLLDIYESIRDAGNHSSVDECTIWGVCNHLYWTAGGFVWSYYDEEPIKPNYEEANKKKIESYKKTIAKKPKKINFCNSPKKHKNKTMPPEVKRQRQLDRFTWWNGEEIYLYDAFGELIDKFKDPIEAKEKIGITFVDLHKNLDHINAHYHDFVIRYASVSFDAYETKLTPVKIYDLQGNFIMKFAKHTYAEKYIGVPSGEIRKTLTRGGSCKGYLFSEGNNPLVRKVENSYKRILMYDQDMKLKRIFNNKTEVYNFFGKKDIHKSLNKAIEMHLLFMDYYWDVEHEFEIIEKGA